MEIETHNRNISKSLDELVDEELKRQIPLMVYLFLLCLFGISGNILVYYIYTRRYTLSTFRIFVTVLAAVDLSISGVIIPLELVQFAWQYTYKNVVICKLTLFVKPWATITSGAILLCIAYDRYRKVCKPFQWQISYRAARIMCFVSGLLGFVSGLLGVSVAWISSVIYDIRTKNFDEYNITITECAITESMKTTVFPLINNGLMTVLFVGALTGIIIMYIFIAVRVKRQMKKKVGAHAEKRQAINTEEISGNSKREIHSESIVKKTGTISLKTIAEKPKVHCCLKVKGQRDSSYTDSVEKDNIKESDDEKICGDTEKDAAKINNCAESNEENRTKKDRESNSVSKDIISSATSEQQNIDIVKLSGKTNKTKKATANTCNNKDVNSRNRYRTTMIMFIVSIAFVISYLPLLSILLIGYANGSYVKSLSDSGRTVYKFLHRSYLLNCAVNPVIYGIWDARFRKSCKAMIRCLNK